MKRIFLFLLTLFMASSAFAGDFITRFLKECVEPERPVSNVNIGKAMLDKMAANTSGMSTPPAKPCSTRNRMSEKKS